MVPIKSQKTITVAAKVSVDLADQIRALAARESEPSSIIIRRLLRRGLEGLEAERLPAPRVPR